MNETTAVPGTRALLRDLAVRPSKGKGQNFLSDPAIVARIAAAAGLVPGDTVIEVGPGLGTLTKELVAQVRPGGQVIAVELDRRLVVYLRAALGQLPGLTIVEADVLRCPPEALLADLPPDTPYTVVANLPYSITSAVLRHFLDSPRRPTRLVVMVQREVAERIVARPPDMSLLAVAVQYYSVPAIVMRLAPGAFIPRPKVESAVLRLDLPPAPPLPEADRAPFFALVAAGFSQRRKTVQNSLAAGLGLPKERVGDTLAAAGIAPARRAETLAVADWLALYARLHAEDAP
jgi:16S rRNA (adenine1518-N6/adenine1519-N6)-dimethyltransferase